MVGSVPVWVIVCICVFSPIVIYGAYRQFKLMKALEDKLKDKRE